MIRTSKHVKQELEKIQKQREFKSLDAVLRYLLDARVTVSGGIFLGTSNRGRLRPIDIHNVQSRVENNFMDLFIKDEKTIELYQCLHCGNIFVPARTEEWDGNVVVPNCGCGHSMAKITIKIEP